MTLINELQRKTIDPSISVSDLLKIAYMVAVKLNINDFEQWIDSELKGYTETTTELPEYRFIGGIMRSFNPIYGWRDVNVNVPWLIEELGHIPVIDKLSEIEYLVKSESEIYRPLPPQMAKNFSQNNYGMQAIIFLNKHQFHGIIDNVRTKILKWTLTLEKEGILSENMTFNEDERASIQGITINNFVGNVANASIQQGIGNTMNIESHNSDIDTAKFLVSELKKIVSNMPNDENKETTRADLETIERQLKSPVPKIAIVKELLKSVRNVIEGAIGSLTASYPAIADAFNKLV